MSKKTNTSKHLDLYCFNHIWSHDPAVPVMAALLSSLGMDVVKIGSSTAFVIRNERYSWHIPFSGVFIEACASDVGSPSKLQKWIEAIPRYTDAQSEAIPLNGIMIHESEDYGLVRYLEHTGRFSMNFLVASCEHYLRDWIPHQFRYSFGENENETTYIHTADSFQIHGEELNELVESTRKINTKNCCYGEPSFIGRQVALAKTK